MSEKSKNFWERKDGKPVSAEDAVKYRAKMLMEQRVRKALDEAANPKPAPAVKTEADREKDLADYQKTRSPRHLGSEG